MRFGIGGGGRVARGGASVGRGGVRGGVGIGPFSVSGGSGGGGGGLLELFFWLGVVIFGLLIWQSCWCFVGPVLYGRAQRPSQLSSAAAPCGLAHLAEWLTMPQYDDFWDFGTAFS